MEDVASNSVDTSQDTGTDNQTAQSGGENETQQTYTPFATGKEKFRVNEKDRELSWEETKKYAQLGFSSQERFEKAAATERKMRENYAQMVALAKENPHELIRLFNQDYRPQQTGHTPQGQPQEGAGDPKDMMLQQYEDRIRQLEGRFSEQEVEKERTAIQQELDSAVAKYPALNAKWMKTYIRDEYRRLLASGVTEYSVEDVAFQVHQEFMDSRKAEQKSKVETLEKNKQRAPVTTTPSRGGGSSSKPMAREEIRKLAGKF